MEIILRQSIKKLGKFGDIVFVKSGYYKNFLSRQGLAMPATKENLKVFESIRKELEEKNLKLYNKAVADLEKIKGSVCVFIKNAAEDGKLYGSVSKKDIAKELSKISNIDVNHNNVVISDVIKYVGISTVDITLNSALNPVQILVNIARSESEANELLTAFKSRDIDNKDENNKKL